MFEPLHAFLNKTTMYRLVLYYTALLLFVGAILGAFGAIKYSPLAIAFSTIVLLLVCLISNKIFASFLRVPTNVESAYITALILALIIAPPYTAGYMNSVPFLFWAGVLAMASKYILNLNNKHLFNPAAFAVALTAITLNQSADWWVGGNTIMFIFVLLGGLLVIKKVQRFDVVISFTVVALLTIVAFTISTSNPISTIYRVLVNSPLVFFAAAMLSEPLTMPPTKNLRVLYGALVGFLFAPQVHFGFVYLTPEMALVVGNIFSYLVSPKGRYVFSLTRKEQVADGVYNFVFATDTRFPFKPGQYMEWTLGHDHPDNRGNRRYFTIASAPTEREVILGVKFYPKPSTFKAKLLSMNPGENIVASQLAGEFVLPRNPQEKLVFIAGGIGITPFRSMLKYLMDKGEKRDIVTLYSVSCPEEEAYADVFDKACEQIGVRKNITLTDASKADSKWTGYCGRIDSALIQRAVPDYKERTFYISGPRTLVNACANALRQIGVPGRQIKTDFFPGLA